MLACSLSSSSGNVGFQKQHQRLTALLPSTPDAMVVQLLVPYFDTRADSAASSCNHTHERHTNVSEKIKSHMCLLPAVRHAATERVADSADGPAAWIGVTLLNTIQPPRRRYCYKHRYSVSNQGQRPSTSCNEKPSIVIGSAAHSHADTESIALALTLWLSRARCSATYPCCPSSFPAIG